MTRICPVREHATGSNSGSKVAEIVLRQERGDPDYGLISRLVPLR